MNQDYSVYIQSQLTIIQKLTNCSIASLVKYDNINVSSETVGVESDNAAPDFTSKDFTSFIINLKEPIGLSQKEYSHQDAINAYTYTYISPVYCTGVYYGAILLLFRTASNLNSSDIESVSSVNQSIQNFLLLQKREKEIKELNKKLEFFLCTGKIAYIEYNFDSRSFVSNKYFNELTGYNFNNDSVELEWLLSRFHSNNRARFITKLDQVLAGTKEAIDYEFRFLTIENKYIWLRFQGQIDKQDSLKLSGVISDITENKKLLINLIEAKNKSTYANELKSKFLANMSHEIRTPMNAIIGFANILSKHITQEPLNKYVLSIKSSGKVLLELINDLLDLEKINSGKMELKYENTNLDILINEIEQTFSLFARERNLKLLIYKQSIIPKSLYIDALKIKQVLLNLVNNALKFTVKGSISIDYSFFYLPDKNAGTLNITVSDTGIGISAKKQKTIFDPFIQEESDKSKDHKGTGLGLSIVQKLINVMGGSIILESKLNKGSKFIISIPDVKASESSIDEFEEPVRVLENIPSKVNDPITTPHFSPADIKLIKSRFADTIIPLWKELTELLSMKKIELLFNELQQLNEQINWKHLSEYTTKLNVLVKSFDIEEIPNHLKTFDVFINAIETYK